MEPIIGVLGILALIWIAAPVVLWVRLADLRHQFRKLALRVTDLEQTKVQPAFVEKNAEKLKPTEAPDVQSDNFRKSKTPAKPIAAMPISAFKIEAQGQDSVRSSTVKPKLLSEPTMAKQSLEGQLASRWFVWIGAAAVSLGGLLFVRYAAQHSLVSPFLRIVFGLMLGTILVAAGEYLRRTKTAADTYIPAALASGGVVTAFGSVYAAYALYGLLGPATAFIGLGLVAIAALALSLLQGPLIAAVGLIGSYLTPALIASQNPQALGLFIYLTVIVAACFALLRQRRWDWLGYLSLIGAFGWAALWLKEAYHQSDAIIIGLFAFTVAAISAFAVEGKSVLSERAGNLLDFRSLSRGLKFALTGGILAIILLAAQVDKADHSFVVMMFFALGVAGVCCFGWLRSGPSFAAPLAAALTWIVLDFGSLHNVDTRFNSDNFQAMAWALLALMGFWLLGVAGYLRKSPNLVWTGLGSLAPVLFLFGIYFQMPEFFSPALWAGLAVLIAAAQICFAALKKNDELAPALLLASAAFLALFAFDRLTSDIWLTLAIAGLAVAFALSSRFFATRHIGLIAALLATLAEGRLFLRHSGFAGHDILPLGLHWPLYGYGLPAFGFWWASRILLDDKYRRFRVALEGLSLGLVITLVSLEIRALIGGGEDAGHLTLLELGAHICAWLGAVYGLVYRQTLFSSVVSRWGARVLLCGASLALVFGCFLTLNPFFNHIALDGGVVLNSLLLAYLVPCLLLGFIAQKLAQLGLEKLRLAVGGMALACILAYFTLELKVLFEGMLVSADFVSEAESYAISLCWLVMAVAFFIAGIRWQRVSLRYGGVVVMALALLKTFGYDFWKLGGLWQIASVMGIGLSLVGVGWLYARFMRGQEA